MDADFTLGIVRDMPVSSIPPGGVYDSTDFLLDQVGVAAETGRLEPTIRQRPGGTTTGVSWVCCPEFPSGAKVIALGANGDLYDATNPVSIVFSGIPQVAPVENSKLFVDKVMMCASDGATAPRSVTAPGGVLAVNTWGGTPPTAKFSAVHLSRMVVGNPGTNPNRIWFSPVPDPTTAWDTTNAYIDTNHNLTGLGRSRVCWCVFRRTTWSGSPATSRRG